MPACRATITPAYGVGPGGQLIRRGYRAHCAACGFLGRVLKYRTAEVERATHNRRRQVA